VAQDQERFGEAEELFLESLEIKREIGDSRGLISTLSNLAGISIISQKIQDARAYLQEALSIVGELEAPPATIALMIPCGYLMVLAERHTEAATLLYAGKQRAEELGYVLDPVELSDIKQGEEKLTEVLSAEERKAVRARAKEMSLKELVGFAQKALKGLEDT
jgi:hypothetical protein